MQYDSDDSGEEKPKYKLPVHSLENSLEEDQFTTPLNLNLRASITLTPSVLDQSNMSEKKSFYEKITDAFSPKGTKSQGVSFEENLEMTQSSSSMYSGTQQDTSSQRQKEIEKEVIKTATEFPNPLEDICGHEEIDGRNEIYYTVDEKISNIPSIEMVNKSHTRANILKNHRRKFYGSITIMEKSIVTENKMAAPDAWIDIQKRARDTLTTLTRITEELKAYGFQNSPQEIKSYVNYFSRLRTLIAKIDNIIETKATNDPDMFQELLAMYMMEEDAFSQGISMQDLTNKFNSNLGASSDMNSTKHGQNLRNDDEDDDKFADATQEPDDSDDEQETTRENPGTSRNNAYEPQFNRTQGIYNPAPPLPNIPPRRHAVNGGPRGPGGPGGPPPPGGPHGGQPPYVPPWGPPPPQRPQQQQQYFPYPPPQRDTPRPNYQGIMKLKCEKFNGNESEFRRFKLTFDSAYVKNRNLPLSDLALLLAESLEGEPLKLIHKYIRNCPTDMSYVKMWKLLEEKYGGQNVEDSYIVDEFQNAPQIKNSSLKEIERVYHVIAVQHAYYKRNDPQSLSAERSLLFQMGKDKLGPNFSEKFVRHCRKHRFVPNFTALKRFLKAEFLIAQETEREYGNRRTTSSVKKMTSEDDGQIGTSKDSDQEDDPNDAFSFFMQNNRTGRKYTPTEFQNMRKPQSFGGGASRFPQGNQRALGGPQGQYSGGYKGGLTRPPQIVSQWKDGQCSCCRQAHALPNCPKFKTLTPQVQAAIVRRDKICFHCLLGVHYTRDCKTDEGKKCGIDGCERYHHKILHRDPKSVNFIGRQIEEECKPDPPSESDLNAAQGMMFKIAQNGAISIQTLICNVLSAKAKRTANVKAIVLIDSGSNVTCIDEGFAEEHNLRVIDTKNGTALHMLNDVVIIPGIQKLVELQLSSIDQSCTKNVTAWTIKDLAKSTSVVDWSEKKKQFPHLLSLIHISEPTRPY